MELKKALAEARNLPEATIRKRRRQSNISVPEHLRVSSSPDITLVLFISFTYVYSDVVSLTCSH